MLWEIMGLKTWEVGYHKLGRRGHIIGDGNLGPVLETVEAWFSFQPAPPASVLCLGEWVQMNTVVCLNAIKHETEGNNLCHQMAVWPCANHLTS